MPTLAKFIEVATSNGCRPGDTMSLTGSGTPVRARYLVGPNGVIYPLPSIADDERLAPDTIRSIERALNIKTGLLP